MLLRVMHTVNEDIALPDIETMAVIVMWCGMSGPSPFKATRMGITIVGAARFGPP